MLVDASLSLPRWLYVGVLLGVLLSVGVAATFVVAVRLFPDDIAAARVDAGATGGFASEARRRVEIRRYLDAVDERFVEDAAVAGESVAFYLPDRDVAVTFDGRTYYELADATTRGVLVEHELPGVALGTRLPFETPEYPFGTDGTDAGRTATDAGVGTAADAGIGTAAATADHAANAAFAVLGLPAGADTEAVRRAYRERVKEVHPDHGGDEAAFERVREAYDTARRHTS